MAFSPLCQGGLRAIILYVSVALLVSELVRRRERICMSKKVICLLALFMAAMVGCARVHSEPRAANPLPSLPVVTLPPTATFVPTLSDKPTVTPIPTVTPTPIVYIVQKGDVLGQIALDHNVSLEALMAANGLRNIHLLSIGQRLIIPNESMLSDLAQAGVDVSAVLPTPDRAKPTLLPGSIAWEAVQDHLGQEVQVEGLVARTRKAGGSVYLFFDDPSLPHLRIKIPPDALPSFDQPEIAFLDKWVLVRGRVEQGAEGVQIVAREPAEISILE